MSLSNNLFLNHCYCSFPASPILEEDDNELELESAGKDGRKPDDADNQQGHFMTAEQFVEQLNQTRKDSKEDDHNKSGDNATNDDDKNGSNDEKVEVRVFRSNASITEIGFSTDFDLSITITT